MKTLKFRLKSPKTIPEAIYCKASFKLRTQSYQSFARFKQKKNILLCKITKITHMDFLTRKCSNPTVLLVSRVGRPSTVPQCPTAKLSNC